MTTSSNHNNKLPREPALAGSHWQELTELLSTSETERLGQWMDTQLAVLEHSQRRFSTPKSRVDQRRR